MGVSTARSAEDDFTLGTGVSKFAMAPFASARLARLDFREEEHAARLAKRLESLETEILSVLEATNQLRESPEFELCELTAGNAEMFDGVVSKQMTLLEKEIIDLTNEADQFTRKIGKLTTQSQPGEKWSGAGERRS